MKKQILIVDDDEAVRGSMKHLLQETGYAVTEASDGAQGVTRLQQEHVDLMILDLGLPKMNGFDLLDFATNHYRTVPILVVTALAGQCEAGALAEADAVLEKPPEVAHLLGLIEQLLAKARAPRPQPSAFPRALGTPSRLSYRPPGWHAGLCA